MEILHPSYSTTLSCPLSSIGPLAPRLCLSLLICIFCCLRSKHRSKHFPKKVIAKVCVRLRTPESLYQSHQGSPNVPKIRSPAHHSFGLVAGQIFATSPKISPTSNTQHKLSEMSLLSVLLRLKQKPQQASQRHLISMALLNSSQFEQNKSGIGNC